MKCNGTKISADINSDISKNVINVSLEVKIDENAIASSSRYSVRDSPYQRNMNQNACVEVTVLELFSKTTNSNNGKLYPAKILNPDQKPNYISDINNFNIHESPLENGHKLQNFNTKVKTSPLYKPKIELFKNHQLDIEHLLRLYACNSNMEKSINKIFEEERKDYIHSVDNHSKDSLDNHVSIDATKNGLLFELNAVYKIVDTFMHCSYKSSSKPDIRCREILNAIQYLINQCNNKEFVDLLARDPSMKICQHCGVISCTTVPDIPVKESSSSRRSSFLNIEEFPKNTSIESNHIRINRNKKKEIASKENVKQVIANCEGKAVQDQLHFEAKGNVNFFNKQNIHQSPKERCESLKSNFAAERINKHSKDNSRETKRMEVESENKSGTQNAQEIKNLENIVTLENCKTGTQKVIEFSRFNGQKLYPQNINIKKGIGTGKPKPKIDTRTKKRNPIKNTVSNTSKRSYDEHIAKGSHLNLILQPARKHKQDIKNQSLNSSNDNPSIVSAVKYLAHGCSADTDNKELKFISQLSDTPYSKTNCINKQQSFPLYNSREDDGVLKAEFLLVQKANDVKESTRPKSLGQNIIFQENNNYAYETSEYRRYSKEDKDLEGKRSLTSSMENDSLENYTGKRGTSAQPGESDTTAYSSSSAENMIHEWVKQERNDQKNCEKSDRAPVNPKSAMDIERFFKNQITKTIEGCFNSFTSSDKVQHSQIDNLSDADRTLSADEQKACALSKQEILMDFEENLNPGLPKEIRLARTRTRKFKVEDSKNSEIINDMVSKKYKNQNTSDHHLAFDTQATNSSHVDEKVINNGAPVLSTVVNSDEYNTKTTNTNFVLNVPLKIDNNCANNSTCEDSESFMHQINYDDAYTDIISNDDNHTFTTKILPLYQRILESTKDMDWKSFQRLVEKLHPSEKELWRDICEAIVDEANRVADKVGDSVEVFIEISPAPWGETKSEVKTYNNEIVFEMDMTLRDVEWFLVKKLVSFQEQLDTYKNSSEDVKVRNGDVRDTKVDLNQVE